MCGISGIRSPALCVLNDKIDVNYFNEKNHTQDILGIIFVLYFVLFLITKYYVDFLLFVYLLINFSCIILQKICIFIFIKNFTNGNSLNFVTANICKIR